MSAAAKQEPASPMGFFSCTHEQLAALIKAAVREEMRAQSSGEELLTHKEAAEFLGLTPNALHKLIQRERITPDKRGGRGELKENRFRRATLQAFIDKG